jgi:hypothetical protein
MSPTKRSDDEWAGVGHPAPLSINRSNRIEHCCGGRADPTVCLACHMELVK